MGKAILAAIVSLVLGVLAEGLGTRWNMAGIGCMVSVAVRSGRKFCVSDFRQSQEFFIKNTHNLAYFPCPPRSPAGRGGMRAGTV